MLLIDFTSSLTFIVAMHAYPAIKSTSHFVSCMALLNPNHLGTIWFWVSLVLSLTTKGLFFPADR